MTENNDEETLNRIIKEFIKSKKYENKTVIRTRPSEQPSESTYNTYCLFCKKLLPPYNTFQNRRRKFRAFCNVRCKRHYQGMNYNSGIGWKENNEKHPKVCTLCGSHDYAVLGLCKKCYAKKEDRSRNRRKEIDKKHHEKIKKKQNHLKTTYTQSP